jgi:hypothetical protein
MGHRENANLEPNKALFFDGTLASRIQLQSHVEGRRVCKYFGKSNRIQHGAQGNGNLEPKNLWARKDATTAKWRTSGSYIAS